MGKYKRTAGLAIAAAVCLWAVPGYSISIGSVTKAVEVAKDVKNVADALTIDDKKEMAIGAQMHPLVVREMGGELNNPKLKQYVNRVGQRVATRSDRKGITYVFTVLSTGEFNAFAIPGGYVYVTQGLLSTLQDESELAAVIGHEITHVAHKHGIKQLQTAILAKTGMKYAGKAAGDAAMGATGSGVGGALIGDAVEKTMHLFTDFALKGYGRDQELDADKFGIHFSNAAGYDPNGAVRMFEYLNKLEDGNPPQGLNALLASHPDTDKRLEVAKAEVATLPNPHGKTVNKPQFLSMVKVVK